jgi:serine/threonine protein kinase
MQRHHTAATLPGLDRATQLPRRSLGNWDLIKTLGKGSMGQVVLARNRNSPSELSAVKIIPRDPNCPNSDIDTRTRREATLSGLLSSHPNIIKLYESQLSDNHYYLRYEYVSGGTLFDLVSRSGPLTEPHARSIARMIASGIQYCHGNSVVHRDLKIDNILLTPSGEVKIIDFGLASTYTSGKPMHTHCGSLYFAAPELLAGQPYQGPSVDVWSFGVVIYVLVVGHMPFDDPSSIPALQAKIKQGQVEYPPWLSEDCKNLLARMLTVDPGRRATMNEVVAHEWMNLGFSSPIKSHIPPRRAIELPLDMAVVREMSALGFGSEEQIFADLVAVTKLEKQEISALTSVYYLVSEKHHHHQKSHTTLVGRISSIQRNSSLARGSSLKKQITPQQQQQQQAPPSPKKQASSSKSFLKRFNTTGSASKKKMPITMAIAVHRQTYVPSSHATQIPVTLLAEPSAASPSSANSGLERSGSQSNTPRRYHMRGRKPASPQSPVPSNKSDSQRSPAAGPRRSRMDEIGTLTETPKSLSLKGLFSVQYKTHKPATLLHTELVRVLEAKSLQGVLTTFEPINKGGCTFQCSVGASERPNSGNEFEVTIVRIPLLSLYGLQFSKSGNVSTSSSSTNSSNSSWKRLVKEIVSGIRL